MAATQTDFGLSQIGQVAIRVRDIDRAVEFYRDRLGMRFLFTAPGLGFFQCGDVTLMLSLPEVPEFDHPSSVIYFAVEDIDLAYRTLRGRGVEFRDEPHLIHRAESYDLWMAFFRDLDDNTLAIMARKPKG
jgi:catechol 2,3-dioxygenase-like lactoylglutathione lyase family enzyme